MSKKPIYGAASYNEPLSRREVALLSAWERERRVAVTIDDIRRSVGAEAAADVARDLVRKTVLQRVRRGTYLVRPFRSMSRPTQASTALGVEALLREEPHYLGGLWAVSLHGMSEQRYASVVDAFVTHRLAPRKLGPGRVRFHVLPESAFSYGIMTTTIEGLDIHVSDPERTLLDAFDHPRIFGGLRRALDLSAERLARLDHSRLLEYAVVGSRPSTCQRLGVLLEREGVSRRKLAALRERAREKRSLLSMDTEASRSGAVNREWNVVENDR